MLKRTYATAIVILRALLPGESHGPPAGPTAIESEVYLGVLPKNVSFNAADLVRLVGKEGKLALFVPGCLALAAPFVLFRLKRQGYSGCRVTSTGEGLFVDARR